MAILTDAGIRHLIENNDPPLVEFDLPEALIAQAKVDVAGEVEIGNQIRDRMDKQVQPGGIDLTVESIRAFPRGESSGRLDYSNHRRHIPRTESLKMTTGPYPSYSLDPGVYMVYLRETVNIPHDLMARTLPRSSLLRMGASVETAVWDAGYSGKSSVLLNVLNPNGIRIYDGARICQMVFERLAGEVEHGYAGQYQNERL